MTDVGSNRLPVLASEVRVALDVVNASTKRAAENALIAGRSLLEAKQLVKHGNWLPFLAEAGIPERTAQRYMTLAESDLQSDTVSLLGGPTPALRFLALRAHAASALDEAEADARAGREGIEPIERALDLIGDMAAMFPPELAA
jgi:hypothetical protein